MATKRAETAVAVLITERGPKNITVDAREKSPYTHDALGGTPTFLGAWNNCVYMMGRANPEDGAPCIDATLVPASNREPGPLVAPILITKLDDEYRPVDFTVECLARLTREASDATSM